VTIRKRRGGWQVIVFAGLDPLTGKQRQLTRQVNGSRREAEKVEARLRTEVADGRQASHRAVLRSFYCCQASMVAAARAVERLGTSQV
jgi:hypothetical protein